MDKKRIAILGSTGSIGRQALDVLENHINKYEVIALSANQNIDLLHEQVEKFSPLHVAVTDEKKAEDFKKKGVLNVSLTSGESSLVHLATLEEVDIVLVAVVGISGLKATIAALEAGKDVALANKETLITGGELVINAAQKSGSNIIPVDSEHSAIFQCLKVASNSDEISKIYLTASGGPFRGYTRENLKQVTVVDALNHPNWKMGRKVTVDSATLMNKGLEVIEAKWLFNLPIDKIEVLIHPQSIIHSMVEFIDGSIIGQFGAPDMRIPILYGLSYPQRLPATANKLNFIETGHLSFEEPDTENFPCLLLAYKASRIGGTMPVVLNAANEVAVEKFLNKEISFMEIPIIIEKAMKTHQVIETPTIDQVIKLDKKIRQQLL